MNDLMLSQRERSELLAAARRTLEEYLDQRRMPVLDDVAPALLERRGCFVTLHRKEQLRGCIGTFEASDRLLDNVQKMAVAAATTDPRFPPVRTPELAELEIEISVLTPLRSASADEVEVGRHGVYISRGFQRGVLLPQVATEYGWDRVTFLEHTCLKAGLPPAAWQHPETLIEVFSAEVFNERELARLALA